VPFIQNRGQATVEKACISVTISRRNGFTGIKVPIDVMVPRYVEVPTRDDVASVKIGANNKPNQVKSFIKAEI
jgi:hypothetical protein